MLELPGDGVVCRARSRPVASVDECAQRQVELSLGLMVPGQVAVLHEPASSQYWHAEALALPQSTMSTMPHPQSHSPSPWKVGSHVQVPPPEVVVAAVVPPQRETDSSEPLTQSAAPSHSQLVGTHEPSPQSNSPVQTDPLVVLGPTEVLGVVTPGPPTVAAACVTLVVAAAWVLPLPLPTPSSIPPPMPPEPPVRREGPLPPLAQAAATSTIGTTSDQILTTKTPSRKVQTGV